MPKYKSIKKVLVIGSGPIIIGQAAEFDYAGTQACRELKKEGLEVVLINSNPATINSNSNITVNVPQGTTAEQAQAISRQVQAQIDASWADMLNGSRAMVPSPEARSF